MQVAGRELSWRGVSIGLLSSALFLWLAVRGIEPDAALAALGSARWGWWALYVLASVAIQAGRAWRWAEQLRALGEPRMARSLSVGAVGLAAIFLLPARLGELVRPVWIASPQGVSVGAASASVVSERLIDGALVGALLLGTGLWVGHTSALPAGAADTIWRGGVLVGGAFSLAMAAVWVAAWQDAPVQRLVAALCGRWPALQARISAAITRFHGGLLALVQGRVLARYLALSALIWAANCVTLVFLFWGFGLELPWSATCVVLGATAVSLLVPAGPASIGPLHLAVIWALGLYGVPDAVGLNIATLLHLAQVLANGAMGVMGAAWMRRGLTPPR
jgi:glycosyltransferase 2 family protein